MQIRYVAIGDSFTEGVGDELPDGRTRGWADLAAQGWADASGQPISYANLAIRGKLAWPIVREQLEPALALKPTHLSFNGGGNDMLRPRTPLASIVDAFRQVRERCREEGVTLILLSGANPSGQLPLRRVIHARGDALSAAVVADLDAEPAGEGPEILRALNWGDRTLARPEFWSPDRLHMNSRGHHRVAARVLDAVGQPVPHGWWNMPRLTEQGPRGLDYYREYVGPWVGRRLRKRSSGDGRAAKYGDWLEVAPAPRD